MAVGCNVCQRRGYEPVAPLHFRGDSLAGSWESCLNFAALNFITPFYSVVTPWHNAVSHRIPIAEGR